MDLSFVVPAYNEEAYLGPCLESILRELQALAAEGIRAKTEIVVVNNASSDSTREVALRYPGVRVVDELRKGLPYARQAGFLATSGALVANVDADSRLPQGWVRQVLLSFRANPDQVALSGPLEYYDLEAAQRMFVRVFYGIAWATYVANRYVLRVGSMVQGGNFVLRRDALEAIGGFNLGITFYGEDTDIARRLQPMGDVSFALGLKMFSSARRLKREGLLTMAARYGINYFWTIFLKRPYSEKHIDIREA